LIPDDVQRLLNKSLPWGPLFAKRVNFESGFLSEEERLVARYLSPGSDVLVLGSGNGREARPICHQGHRIICVDLGPLYLVAGRRLFLSEGVDEIVFVQADVAALPFAKNSFDFVFFSFYSSQGEKRFDVMHGIYQVMRPGGHLLLTVCTPKYRQIYRKAHLPMSDWVFFSGAEQLDREVASCGFILLESNPDPLRPEYRLSMLKKAAQQRSPCV